MIRLALGCLLAMLAAEPQSSGGGSVWRAIEIVDLEGRRYTDRELQGRVVLLDFWATWCAPCLAELPTLTEVQRRHGGRDGFLLIGVSIDRGGRAGLRGFLRRHGVEWPQVHDGRGLGGELARRFGVEAVPRSVLVDRRGNVVALDLRGEVLLAALEGLMTPAQFSETGTPP